LCVSTARRRRLSKEESSYALFTPHIAYTTRYHNMDNTVSQYARGMNLTQLKRIQIPPYVTVSSRSDSSGKSLSESSSKFPRKIIVPSRLWQCVSVAISALSVREVQ
jgi:hypothetical protein